MNLEQFNSEALKHIQALRDAKVFFKNVVKKLDKQIDEAEEEDEELSDKIDDLEYIVDNELNDGIKGLEKIFK